MSFNRVIVLLATAVVLVAAGSPVHAATCTCSAGIGCTGPVGGCPPGYACVDVGAGVNAQTLADCVEDAWSFPDFACDVSAGDPTTLVVTVNSGPPDARAIQFVIPGVNTPQAHAYKLRVEMPTGANPNGGPFNMFVKYDNRSDVLLVDGTTVFPDITNIVTSQPAAPAGGPGPTGVPVLDGHRTALLALGLIGAGVAFIVLRRR
jgi:hypothetical protein